MIKQPICVTVTCDVCDYVFDEDDDGIVHFATPEIALECVRNAGWWATETAILCNGGDADHAPKAAEIADRIEAGDPDGQRTAEFLSWCEKTGYEIDATAEVTR